MMDTLAGVSTLTLKQVPEALLDQLRADAEAHRRSMNQHALALLEAALQSRRPSFAQALAAYRQQVEADGGDAEVLEDLRDDSPGRSAAW